MFVSLYLFCISLLFGTGCLVWLKVSFASLFNPFVAFFAWSRVSRDQSVAFFFFFEFLGELLSLGVEKVISFLLSF